MESSWRITNWKLDSSSKRRNSSSTMGCGERIQTFSNLELTVALTIVAKASGIGAQGQERCGTGFHTRHGCARHKFRGVSGQDCLERQLESGNAGAPNPFKTIDLGARSQANRLTRVRRARRTRGPFCAQAAWRAGRPGGLYRAARGN